MEAQLYQVICMQVLILKNNNSVMHGTLSVSGATTLASTLAVSGATGIDGGYDVNYKFTVAASSGNTGIAGTLGVTNMAHWLFLQQA